MGKKWILEVCSTSMKISLSKNAIFHVIAKFMPDQPQQPQYPPGMYPGMQMPPVQQAPPVAAPAAAAAAPTSKSAA